MSDYRQNLEESYLKIYEKMDLLEQEVERFSGGIGPYVIDYNANFSHHINHFLLQMDQMMHERNLVCVWHLNIFKPFEKRIEVMTQLPSPSLSPSLRFSITW